MRKVFLTCIKKDHKLGEKEYVRGRISAAASIICHGHLGNTVGYMEGTAEGMTFKVICTPELYSAFAKQVEATYPGLCIFNYIEEQTEENES